MDLKGEAPSRWRWLWLQTCRTQCPREMGAFMTKMTYGVMDKPDWSRLLIRPGMAGGIRQILKIFACSVIIESCT